MTECKRIIVGYKGDTTSQASLDAVANLGNVKDIYSAINAISVELDAKGVGKIRLDPNVRYVEYDQVAQILAFPAPEIPTGRKQVLALSQQIPWGVSKIRADQVWGGGNKGTGIKVGIIDTGIDYNHEDLKGNYKGGYNFIANTSDPLDDNGHGIDFGSSNFNM